MGLTNTNLLGVKHKYDTRINKFDFPQITIELSISNLCSTVLE